MSGFYEAPQSALKARRPPYPYLRGIEKKVVMRPNCLMLRGDRVFGRNRNYDMSNQKCRKTNKVEWFPMGRNIERGIG